MPDIFEYIPHPHLEHLKQGGPPSKDKVVKRWAGASKLRALNAKIGLKITVVVGTMWCAYLFTLLALVSVKSAFGSGDIVTIVAWIAQTFLQLVLLPIIIVGQNVQADAADERAEATYKDAVALLEEARQIQAHLLAQDEAIERILTHLNMTEPPPTAPSTLAAT